MSFLQRVREWWTGEEDWTKHPELLCVVRSYMKTFDSWPDAAYIVPDDRYPVYYLQIGDGKRHVFISGGVHGDEPCGSLAASQFAQFLIEGHQKQAQKYLDEFSFHIIPCVNPWGFEHHIRENSEGIDLNRDFKNPKAQVTKNIIKLLNRIKENFVFSMDMHEGSCWTKWKDFPVDANPNGAWLYELCREPELRIGRSMIEAVRAIEFPICKLPTIYDDICIDGLVTYPEGNRNSEYGEMTSFDAYLWETKTKQSFTSETCTNCQLGDRINAQLTMLKTALNEVLRRPCTESKAVIQTAN